MTELLGHLVYIGNDMEKYVKAWEKETRSFSEIQEVNLKIWSEKDILSLINNNYEKEVLDAFHAVLPYAYKSDLARLLILDVFGGWYSDFGTLFLKKIETSGKDLIMFKDFPAKKMFNSMGIQNSLFFAKPENHFIKHSINVLLDVINNKDYGNNFLDITGPIRLYRSIMNSEIYLKESESLNSCGEFECLIEAPHPIITRSSEDFLKNPFTYNNKIITSAYSIDSEIYALYKNYAKSLKTKSQSKDKNSNYIDAYNSKNVFLL